MEEKRRESYRGYQAKNNIMRYSEQKISAPELEEREKQRQIKKYQNYGSSKEYLLKGRDDRLLGLYDAYTIRYNPDSNMTSGELISYRSGYESSANRMILIGAVTGKYTSEMLKNIGYADALDPNITFENLPVRVQKNKDYLEGYTLGLEKKNKTR